MNPRTGALPNLVVIGAMKCGTTALHNYLDAHPDIGMAARKAPHKEVNFFVGPAHRDAAAPDTAGNWHRGWDWYASLFDPGFPVRGECSPGYTSPDHIDVAGRMASRMPHVRLVYLVRDPLRRAVSQYHHHTREGDERRPMGEALLDPCSQYIARSRYHERLAPFLRHFAAEQVLVVVQERLLTDRRSEVGRVYAHAGADPHWWEEALLQEWHVGTGEPHVPADLRQAFAERVHDDVDKLRSFVDDDLAEWTC